MSVQLLPGPLWAARVVFEHGRRAGSGGLAAAAPRGRARPRPERAGGAGPAEPGPALVAAGGASSAGKAREPNRVCPAPGTGLQSPLETSVKCPLLCPGHWFVTPRHLLRSGQLTPPVCCSGRLCLKAGKGKERGMWVPHTLLQEPREISRSPPGEGAGKLPSVSSPVSPPCPGPRGACQPRSRAGALRVLCGEGEGATRHLMLSASCK